VSSSHEHSLLGFGRRKDVDAGVDEAVEIRKELCRVEGRSVDVVYEGREARREEKRKEEALCHSQSSPFPPTKSFTDEFVCRSLAGREGREGR